jgi:CheY-like chemotaxis protein
MIYDHATELTILIAEDDEGHAELIMEHLQDAGVHNKIIRFKNGQEAWDFLEFKSEEKQKERSDAYLLLLDIRMPKMDGIEVLKRIKANHQLRNLPVIMLTTTNDPREIQGCYDLGCNCYITKPVQYEQFSEAIRQLGLFISIIQVPPIQPAD